MPVTNYLNICFASYALLRGSCSGADSQASRCCWHRQQVLSFYSYPGPQPPCTSSSRGVGAHPQPLGPREVLEASVTHSCCTPEPHMELLLPHKLLWMGTVPPPLPQPPHVLRGAPGPGRRHIQVCLTGWQTAGMLRDNSAWTCPAATAANWNEALKELTTPKTSSGENQQCDCLLHLSMRKKGLCKVQGSLLSGNKASPSRNCFIISVMCLIVKTSPFSALSTAWKGLWYRGWG